MTDEERYENAVQVLNRHNLLLANGDRSLPAGQMERLADAVAAVFGDTPPEPRGSAHAEGIRGTFTLRIIAGVTDGMRSFEDLARSLEKQAGLVRTYGPLIQDSAWVIRDKNGAAVGSWSFGALPAGMAE